MARFSDQFRFRSLTISVLALLLVPFAVPAILLWPPVVSSAFLIESAALCSFGIAVCVAGYINLIHDERKGYSRDRISLAAVLLLLALAPHGLLAFMLVQHFSAK